MSSKDQLQGVLELKNTPKRIISLVPSQTELLVDLGLEKAIVGITKFCVHPSHLTKTKTIVGGTKQVNIEKIKQLQPDIILCNKEENSLDTVKQLQPIAPIHISDIYTLEDSLALIRVYGKLFLKETAANIICQKINDELASFKSYVANKPKIRVAYFIWKTPWMVAANKTFIHYMLGINKFYNVYADLERYPEINIEDMQRRNIDTVLLSSEPFPFSEKHSKIIEKHLNSTSIILVDGEYFSWYGSRLTRAFKYFKHLREVTILNPE